MLICNICEKNEDEVKIIKKTGLCIKCKRKETNKLYYENNKENILESIKEYYEKEDNKRKKSEREKEFYKNNKERILKRQNEYYKNNKEISKKSPEYNRNYYLNNKERKLKLIKDRIKNDTLFKLKCNIRCLIRNSFTIGRKSNKTTDILGCSFEEFKLYLESKFEDWMTWDNRGLYNGELYYGWDIDHKIPLASAETEEDIIKLNHYTNLQPLCSKVNRHIKRDYIDYK
jgi:hypothetical protein